MSKSLHFSIFPGFASESFNNIIFLIYFPKSENNFYITQLNLLQGSQF